MPMDLSAVRALCDAAAPVMRDLLWVSDIRLDLVYGPCESGSHDAECERNAPYRRATITIDPARADDETDVLDSLRHELLHVALGEFDVFWEVAGAGVEADTPSATVLQRAWTLACERTVNTLENALDRMGWTSTAMAGRDTACAGCGRSWRAAAPEGTEAVPPPTVVVCPGCGEPVTHGHTPKPESADPDRSGADAGGEAVVELVQVRNPSTQRWELLSTETGRILTTSAEELAGIPVRPRA